MDIKYLRLNFEVMTDTADCCNEMPELKSAIKHSIAKQYMVAEEDKIELPVREATSTKYWVSGKRSFEAAKAFPGMKVAVLNYANNHSIGGAPYLSGAQEESLCRCSTLLPCLQAMKEPFYQKHIDMYHNNEMDSMGNDDLIYTPDVVVFKTDVRTDPIYPQMMDSDSWYTANVITCAAPVLSDPENRPENYEDIMRARIRKILDVAAKEGNEVIILGAWGCGAFKNPIAIVSKLFVECLKDYSFPIVVFALGTTKNVQGSVFAKALQAEGQQALIDNQ